jgi:hypothetical protein
VHFLVELTPLALWQNHKPVNQAQQLHNLLPRKSTLAQTGGNMESRVAYYDTSGEFKTMTSDGPERHPLAVRYRTLATRSGKGSVAIFPAPHRYFFPRDFTTNMGYVWHSGWRGLVSLGIRQYPDDAPSYYPWSNAPPATEQRMGMFLLLHPGDPHIVAIATDSPLTTSLPRFDIGDVTAIAEFIAACRLPAPAAWN